MQKVSEREKKAHNTKNCNYNFLPSTSLSLHLTLPSTSFVVTSLCLFATGICAQKEKTRRQKGRMPRSIYEDFT